MFCAKSSNLYRMFSMKHVELTFQVTFACITMHLYTEKYAVWSEFSSVASIR